MASQRYFTKSEAAFRFSFRTLVQRNPKIYFWSFTAADPMPDWQFADAWHRFWSAVYRRVRFDFEGLRTFEPHMGHGERRGFLHAHMVCNERLPVADLRALARGTGIGPMMKVERADAGLEDYLCKYLTKSFSRPGSRCWAKLGDWEHTRKCDIVVESREANFFRACYKLTRRWDLARVLASKYDIWERWNDPKVTLRNWRERLAIDPDWADLAKAMEGFPKFAKNEISL